MDQGWWMKTGKRVCLPMLYIALILCCTGCSPVTEGGTVQWVQAQFRSPADFVPGGQAPVSSAALPAGATAGADGTEIAVLDEARMLHLGAHLYAVNCAPCHRANGEGNLNRFPPLNDSPLVTSQRPAPLIETVLWGREVMPAFSPTLNDVEVTAVLSYIRQAWNNQASALEPSQVQEVRQSREQ